MGMSVEEFYDGHAWLAVSYRRADIIRRERSNFDAYLQATYMYDVLLRVAPAYNSLKPQQANDWIDKPYDLFAGDRDKRISGDAPASGGANARAIAFVQSFAAAHNRKLAAEQGGDGASDS